MQLAEAGVYILTNNGEHGHKAELDAGLNGTSDTFNDHSHEVKVGIIQDNHAHQLRKSEGGLSETNCELGCSGCKGDKMFSINPKHVKLSEEDEKRIGLTELLMLNGTAIAEGLWKGTHFSAEVLKEGLERVSNKRIDVEHLDETWENVKGFNYKPRWNEELNGIDVSGAIFDERVIDWFKENPSEKIGLSVRMSENAKFEIIDGQKTCTYFDIKGIALTLNPACKVCWINEAETLTLSSSSDDESDGGIEMAEEKKTPEELAAEKKKLAEEKKLADEKQKLADEKKLEDEKNAKKLAEDKATEDKLSKEKEDAAAAKLAAANSKLSDELLTKFSDMQTQIDDLKQANKTLSDERSLSETNTLVNGLIESGKLSEAKRGSTTQILMALSDDKDRAAFLNTIGGSQSWVADEKGLTLSDDKEDKDDDKDDDLTFSDEDRGIIT